MFPTISTIHIKPSSKIFKHNDDIVSIVKDRLNDINGLLRENAWDSFKDNIKSVEDVNEINSLIENGNMVSFPWCGDEDCGKAIEELTDIDLLGTYKEDIETDDVCAHCGKPAKHVALIAKTY